MDDLLFRVLLAHLFGDYLFQPKKMAVTKSEKSWRGIAWCTLHSLIYTCMFAIFFQNLNPLFLFLVFLSHWPIDFWSLGKVWLKLIRGRSFESAITSNSGSAKQIDLSFTVLVYTVVDNTLHLFLLWLIVPYFN